MSNIISIIYKFMVRINLLAMLLRS